MIFRDALKFDVRKKNVVVYNLPESGEWRKYAKNIWRNGNGEHRAKTTILLIRLGKRVEYKSTPVLVKLRDEETEKRSLGEGEKDPFSDKYSGALPYL